MAQADRKRMFVQSPVVLHEALAEPFQPEARKPPVAAHHFDPLLTAEDVAARLKVSTDWVWDHSSRKQPFLPVIRMGDGTLRYRQSGIERFIDERERVSAVRRRA